MATGKQVNAIKGIMTEVADTFGLNVGDLLQGATGGEYKEKFNDFLSDVVNKIGLTLIQHDMWVNPLSMLKTDRLEFGSDLELLKVNPVLAKSRTGQHNGDTSEAWTTFTPSVRSYYLRKNRGQDGEGDRYPLTVSNARIREAALNENSFASFIDEIVTTLITSNEIDEFAYTKAIFNQAVNENKIVKKYYTGDLQTEQDLKNIVKDVRLLFRMFQFPRVDNNPYSQLADAKGAVKSWAKPTDIMVIMTAGLEAANAVEVLANAFNMDKTDFLGRVLVIDEFDNPDVALAIFDRRYVQIHDAFYDFNSYKDPDSSNLQFRLNVEGIFDINPFSNAVAFVKQGTPPTPGEIVFEDTEFNITSEGGTTQAAVIPASYVTGLTAELADGTDTNALSVEVQSDVDGIFIIKITGDESSFDGKTVNVNYKDGRTLGTIDIVYS